ncbi:ABC transporter permease [Alcaligenaceae bacterium]|nr:ABC transporter permease [Alcaligenaceae bacterium]
MASKPLTPTITIDADGTRVRLDGHWNAAALSDRKQWRALRARLRDACGRMEGTWDLAAAQGFDHVAAQVLWHGWGGRYPVHLEATGNQRAILERVATLTPRQAPGKDEGRWRHAYLRLGQGALDAGAHVAAMIQLLGQVSLDILRLLRQPRGGPWRDFSAHLYRMGAQALPITALVGFLIGVVVAYLLSLQLRQFGADAFIVNILGISLTRELGPLLGAILVAGRSGSAIAAQIGVMRINEELDAMRVMGIAHGFRLVMPRVLALALAMPLISLWTTLAALLGGMLAADINLGLSPAYFIQALPAAVDIAHLWLATAKSVVFGVAIALIGCHWGLRVKPNTESLGSSTTASVVTSITAVMILDAIFAVLFRNVGF